MSRFSDNYPLLDEVIADVDASGVTSLTSNTRDVSMRTKLSIQFVCADHVAGNGVFKVWVSNDGENWVQYNRLTTNVTNTNGQTDTRVASVTLSADGSSIVFFPVGDYFRYIGVSVDITTDGTYSAILQAID